MSKKKILVVDDEEYFTKMVKLNLEALGKYEVKIENRGIRAVVVAKEFMPDMIFLDVVMPDLDGGQVAQRIKEVPSLKNVPIVFLTAIVEEKDVAARDGFIGGHPFLAKPVTTKQLVEYIEEYTS